MTLFNPVAAFTRSRQIALTGVALLLAFVISTAHAQFDPPFDDDDDEPSFGGIFVDADCVLRAREPGKGGDAGAVRARAKRTGGIARANVAGEDMVFVSLPRLFGLARESINAGEELSAIIPIFAELENVADLSVLAALIRQDGLAQKVGWDASWLLDESAYPVHELPVPHSADTAVAVTSGSLVAGGVQMNYGQTVAPGSRAVEAEAEMQATHDQARRLRSEAPVKSAIFRPSGSRSSPKK